MNAADRLLPHVGRTFRSRRPRAGRAPVRTLLAVRLRVLPELHGELWAAQYRTPDGREVWVTAGCFLQFMRAAVVVDANEPRLFPPQPVGQGLDRPDDRRRDQGG